MLIWQIRKLRQHQVDNLLRAMTQSQLWLQIARFQYRTTQPLAFFVPAEDFDYHFYLLLLFILSA